MPSKFKSMCCQQMVRRCKGSGIAEISWCWSRLWWCREHNETDSLTVYETIIQPLTCYMFRREQNIYLHFMSFRCIDMAQVVEILPLVRQELIYSTWSIVWLLMPWRRKGPGHQQPWYILWRTGLIWPPHVKGLNLSTINVGPTWEIVTRLAQDFANATIAELS